MPRPSLRDRVSHQLLFDDGHQATDHGDDASNQDEPESDTDLVDVGEFDGDSKCSPGLGVEEDSADDEDSGASLDEETSDSFEEDDSESSLVEDEDLSVSSEDEDFSSFLDEEDISSPDESVEAEEESSQAANRNADEIKRARNLFFIP